MDVASTSPDDVSAVRQRAAAPLISSSPFLSLSTQQQESSKLLANPKVDDPFDPTLPARKGKQLPLAGFKGFLAFLVALVVGIPSLVFFFIPLTVISFIVKFVASKACKAKKPAGAAAQPAPAAAPSVVTPRANRTYDLVVFGATGFTGKLAVKYLAEYVCRACVCGAVCSDDGFSGALLLTLHSPYLLALASRR